MTTSTHVAALRPAPRLADLALYFVQLGTFGFGGPIALTAAMHRDLVEARGWISDSEYREGLALAQLAPGPLAAQLAIYLGSGAIRPHGGNVCCRGVYRTLVRNRAGTCGAL